MPAIVFVNRRRSLGLGIWFSSKPNIGEPGFKPAPMPTGRRLLTSIPLSNDRGAFVGGQSSSTLYSTTNEIYNFTANTWTAGAPMPTGRFYLTSIPLSNDRGVFVGGETSSGIVGFNEIYYA
ncbi:MAG: kelch repeat-containing protein [Candidatus Aenigmatarchaeota archaeon]